MKRTRTIPLAAGGAALVTVALICFFQFSGACGPPRTGTNRPPKPAKRPLADGRTYAQVLADIASRRESLAHQFRRAASREGKIAALRAARDDFVRAVDAEIFPFWYGTEWDYNGTTEVPGDGRIACGYFVSTVLKHAGLRVERVRLAQQASELIIKSLAAEAHIKRFRGAPIAQFVRAVRRWGPGLYVVGLDNHAGFIVHAGSEIYFVHCSSAPPGCVVREEAARSPVLAASRYRVLGKISQDDDLLVKWLTETHVATRLR